MGQRESLMQANPYLAEEWHPTKNGELKPDMVSRGSGQKVWWKCQNGHEWKAVVNNRNKGSGCPYCTGRKVLSGYNDLATTHPDLASEWHPSRNRPLMPTEISIGSVKKVWWLGKCGHEWFASTNTRSKNGCPYCAGKAVLSGFNDIATTHPELAAEWHPTKNGELTPAMISRGSVKKVWWLGKCGHEWQMTVNNRSFNHGCPVCVQRYHSSFPEQAVYYYIKKYFPDAINRYRDGLPDKMEIDVLIPSLNIGIEYDGIAWHSSKRAKQRDIKKYLYCKTKEIKLIRIKETDCSSDYDDCDIYIPIVSAPSDKDLDDVISKLFEILIPEKTIPVDVALNSTRIKEGFFSSLPVDSLLSNNPTLAEEWHSTKNGLLSPDMFTPLSHEKVWWLGKCGHEWQAVISSRSAGNGCPYCANMILLTGFNDLGTTNPELAKEWHPTKNGELTPQHVIAGSARKVWWLGKCGHEWETALYYRNSGSGCPYCISKRLHPQINSVSVLRPDLVNEWHPTKNEGIDPSMFTCSSREKVWWRCQYGHEWQAIIGNRSRGHICPICARIKRGVNDLATLNPELAGEWHPDKNGEVTPQDVGRGSRMKAWWIGRCGHEWQATVSNRYKGNGCPYCSGRKK